MKADPTIRDSKVSRLLAMLVLVANLLAVPTVRAVPPPDDPLGDEASDSFEGRQRVSSQSPLFSARNEFATRQNLEPDSPRGTGRSVWWTWTVPATGRYEMEGNGSLVDVFRGDQLDRLEPVAAQQVAIPLLIFVWGSPPLPTFTALQGEQLVVRGDVLPGATANASVRFSFRLLLPPLNDNFADANVLTNTLTGEVPFVESNLSGATSEPGESFPAARSVWWRWTPPATGDYVMERPRFVANRPMLGRPRMEVLLGEKITELAKVAELTPDASSVRFAAQAGRTYRIKMDQQNDADAMVAVFRVLPAPLHDDPTDPLDIREGPETVRVSVDGAGVMPWEKWAIQSRSVWLRWRAPADGFLAIRPLTADETMLVIGPETGFKDRIPTVEHSWGFNPATFPVTAETTYLISAIPNDRISGELKLEVDFTSWKVIRPTDGSALPGGTSQLSAEVAPVNGTKEAAITGVDWGVRSRSAGSASPRGSPGAPVFSGNGAVWSEVPSGVWQLRVRLTNEYGRQIFLPPVTVRLPPLNDTLAGAVTVPGLPWSSPSVPTAGAGLEPGEPVHPDNSETNSVWWTWTPPADAVVVAYGKGNAVAAFTGSEMANLRLVGHSAFRPLRIQARAGQSLMFRVTPNPRRFWTQGTVEFELRPQLPGDEFSTRTSLPPEGGPFLLPVGPSTVESGELQGNDNGVLPSLWWSWVPPDNGTLLLRGTTYSSGQEGYVSMWRVFEGEILESLVELQALRWRDGLPLQGNPLMDPGSAAFAVRRGVPVQIAGELLAYSRAEALSRLEFVADPGADQMGFPAVVNPDSFTSSMMFPVVVESGDSVVMEVSENLSSWVPYWTGSFEQGGTAWLGPWPGGEGGMYFRIVRTKRE
jgi:hypothetical protein